ncbi:MAG: hypothetical protein P4K86_01255 [Terracidiphilus sp.]|nr:hypothetical protein [Terracidiphilus sp.]
MTMRLGTESKGQVVVVIVLFSIIAVVGGKQIYDSISSPSTPARPSLSPQPALRPAAKSTSHPALASASTTSGPEAQKLNNTGLETSLHLSKLAQTEQFEYRGTGRNIFSAESAQPIIETPIKSARENLVAAVQPAVQLPPRPPAIDLKYYGHSQTGDKSMRAFFLHRGDIFLARSGDIVNHRYKIGVILPGSAQVTDLGYNNTQTLPLIADN